MANGATLSWHRHGPLTLVSLLLLAACGDGGPTDPDNSNLEIVLVRGDGQAAEPGQPLPVPLEVRVQRLGDQKGEEGVRVWWHVVVGAGAVVDPPLSESDSTGMVSAHLTLGPSVGTYRVRASVGGMVSPPVEFSAEAILVPVLTLVPSGPVRTGDTIQLGGDNFSLIPDQNVVTFSRVRGRVVSSTSSELQVEVPRCLPGRDVEVRVQIGTLSTGSAPLGVAGGPTSLLLGRGEDRVLDASEGFACFHLPSSQGSSYLVVPHSTGTVGGAQYEFSLTGLTADGVTPSATGGRSAQAFGALHPPTSSAPLSNALGAQERWDEWIRTLEGRILAAEEPPVSPGTFRRSPALPFRVPQLGDARDFNVLNAKGTFDEVTARIRYISSHSLIYLDDQAPGGGFTDSDLAGLAQEFENPIYPTITGAFGSESDLDANGRVIILLTPAVNRLTESGSEGFIGGFFYGLDLLQNQEGSNEGEIFYALVPDPTGLEGPPLSLSTVRSVVPAILAHEFEHMVNFNLRILVGGAASQEALWLSEALAQMAEDLVGEAFEEEGFADKAYQFRVGNWGRARQFLLGPGEVSVLASLPPGTLAERGAGWLLLKQISGQAGQNDLLRDLAGSTSTGVENLTQAIGATWGELLADWVGSLFLDDLGVPVRPELLVPGVNLRTTLNQFDGSYPLAPWTSGASSFFHSGSLRSSAPEYYVITPPVSGGVALTASGTDGRPPEPPMGLQVLVVRIQ